MSSIRTILVPIDFSETSDHALSYAIDLAGRLGSKLILVHALHVQSLMTPSGEWWEGVRSAALEGLEVARQRAEAEGKICETQLSDLYPVDAILEAATKFSADLIVMGTHGRSGLAHMVLGSVTERTLRQAPCPVLTLNEAQAERVEQGTSQDA